MKTNIYNKYTMAYLIALMSIFSSSKAQTYAETFDSFTLAPGSGYSNTNSVPFVNYHASFEYKWDTAYDFWSGGFAYANKIDSATGTFSNLYGVRAGKGYNDSDIWVVGQDRGTIKLSVQQTTVNGFYVTNTTYAYKAMAKGNAFSRKFGDTTGTGSGTTIPQGSYPDYLKLIVKGYYNGSLKNDSITVMLADFTYTNNTQDFILAGWQFVNTSSIGAVDSIRFFMRSSDMGPFGINTPLFYAIDNFETTVPNPAGVAEVKQKIDAEVYPNPFDSQLNIKVKDVSVNVRLTDISGKVLYASIIESQSGIDFSSLQKGIYILELSSGNGKEIKRIIKN